MFSETLRYRGSDPEIKDLFKQKAIYADSEPSEPSVIDRTKSLFALTSFDQPPAGAKFSYAYGINPDADIFCSIKEMFCHPLTALNELYHKLTSEEQDAINIVSEKVKSHYLAQTMMTALNISPITYGILALLFQTGVANGEITEDKLQEFIFNNGAPFNGTDLCKGSTANQCGQFFVSQNNMTVVQGASYLTTTQSSLEDVVRTSHDCGNETHLMDFLKKMFDVYNETAIDNQTCYTAVYSPGKTINRANALFHVSEDVCHALYENANSVLQPCIKKAAHILDGENIGPYTPSRPVQDDSGSELFVLATIFAATIATIAVVWPCAFPRQQRDENREDEEAGPIPRLEEPAPGAAPASPKSTADSIQIEITPLLVSNENQSLSTLPFIRLIEDEPESKEDPILPAIPA